MTPFKPKPQSRKRNNVVHLVMSDEENERFRALAKKHGLSLKELCYQAVMYALDNMEQKP